MLMQIVNILFYDLYLVFSVIIALMTEFIKPKNQASLFTMRTNVQLVCASNTEKPGMSVKCAYSA